MIIDGANEVESLFITDNMSSNMLSFLKQSSKLKKTTQKLFIASSLSANIFIDGAINSIN